MTREEILKAFLEDDYFISKGILKEKELAGFKWTAPINNKLIDVLKLSIDGELSNESSNITEKKINQLLNQ